MKIIRKDLVNQIKIKLNKSLLMKINLKNKLIFNYKNIYNKQNKSINKNKSLRN